MKLFIPKDHFDNPHPPQVFLCNTWKKILGELPVYDVSLNGKWNAYSELTLSIDSKYTDILTGETKVSTLFDKAEGLRKIYVKNIGYFIIQDPDVLYADKDSKTLTCFSSEYETGSKYLENFRVNTGDVDSAEVIYLSSLYGENYTIDTPYEFAVPGSYDPYESYYIKQYSDADSYVYEQIQIVDETTYETHFGNGANAGIVLYIKKYPNVRFYYPTKPEISLLHLIFKKIPEWTIGNVDVSLWRKERKFDQDRIAVYDFLMNEVSDTFKCVVEWDTINNKVNFYEEAEDGIADDNTVQTRFDTDVFISRVNLANDIQVKYSTDNIKTKLKVSGSDNLDIREVNLGKNYIMNLDYYHTVDWMGQDLFEAYDRYIQTVKEYSPQYTETMQKWVAAYNQWNDLMNAVPATNDVILVGDLFKQLYCVYTAQYELSETTLNTAVTALEKKLKTYQVYKDIDANKADNVLLKLKNDDLDTATIRVYNSGTEQAPVYVVYSTVVDSGTGLTLRPSTYTLEQWVRGDLNASKLGFEGFTVSAIGTLGAYFCLTKDETKQENLQDYGVRLLREKRETYMAIFQAQTEQMFSQEKYQCVAMDVAPIGAIVNGTRWLDTSTTKLHEYHDGNWIEVDLEADASNYENYQRYIDNYSKLQAVQEVLAKKAAIATYWLDGYAVPNRRIIVDADDGQSLEANMQRAAQEHFTWHTVSRKDMNVEMPLYTFTTSKYPGYTFVVYLKGTKPYVAFADSQGVCQANLDRISKATDFEKFFSGDQWRRLSPLIREDEFSDDNFLLTGYESEEERLQICQELMDTASKELKTLAQPSLEFSMNMANILALPEFESLTSQFQLGNFIRVHIHDGYVKRVRLLEVHIKFDDLSDFSANFGNLVTTKSEIDKHADLLKQAVTAGKQVAASAGNWQRAVDKTNTLEQAIANGLADATLEVGKASSQSIVWNENGIWCRKLIDGTTDQYDAEQIRIINNKILYSNDGFQTAKSAFGSFTFNGQTYSGVLADALVGGVVHGAEIFGGSLEIGGPKGKFIVSEDGSVQILAGDDTPVYATKDDMDFVSQARQYYVEIIYSGSTVFSEPNSSCVLTCEVYSWENNITDKIIAAGGTFSWIRSSTSDDTVWNTEHANCTTNTITIKNNDVEKNCQFTCEVNFDHEKISY